jgi:hypothetical protein
LSHSARLTLVLMALSLVAACGDGGVPTSGPLATIGTPDPHPCDLLSFDDASGVLGVAVTGADRSDADPTNGWQAACTWEGADPGVALDVLVEGPAFFGQASAGYQDSPAAYQFWRDDALEAGFSVVDVEAVGDAAFLPVIGEGPLNTMVMRSGDYLVHLALLGPGGEAQLTAAARLVAAALDRYRESVPAGS